MRATKKTEPFIYLCQLAPHIGLPIKRRFVCADCRSLIEKTTTAVRQRRYASSGPQWPAFDRSIVRRARIVGVSKQYHKSSQKPAAAVGHHSSHSPDEADLSAGQLSFGVQGQLTEDAPSIRNQLRQWRKEHNNAATSARGGHPEASVGPEVETARIQIDAPNFIGRQDDVDSSNIDEIFEHDINSPDDLDSHLAYPTPGDLVQLSLPRGSGPSESLCILVREVGDQTQFITSKGYWYVSAKYDMQSSFPNFASHQELAPIMPHLPSAPLESAKGGSLPILINEVGEVPIDVATPLVIKLVQVEQDIDAFRRRHALAFDKLYETLADDEELLEWKLEDCVARVFGIPHSELLIGGRLAIERFASQSEHGIVYARFLGKEDVIYVRSRRDMREKSQVINWVRMYQESAAKAALGKDVKAELRQNPLSSFINTAHRLILRSRRIRSPTTIGLLGPSTESGDGGMVRAVDTGETLTKNDNLILRLLFEISQMRPVLAPIEAHSICALICRAVGAYPNMQLSRKVTCLILQELGLIPPWQDRRINSYRLHLPGSGVWPYQDKLVAEAQGSCKDLGVFRDLVPHARKDWGQMPVYCIDSKQSSLVDDGISVERVTTKSDCVWIHVHTANPAAYISRDHPIGIAAKEAGASTYTPSRHFSMMPLDFAENIPSLAANRPVLTVSSLLQPDGSVSQVQMSLGVVHNVIRLTPTAVEDTFGGEEGEKASMIIGGERQSLGDDGRDSEILTRAMPNLLLIRQFLKYRYGRRREEWPEEERMERINESNTLSTWTNIDEQSALMETDKIVHWRGDPVIAVEGNRFPRIKSTFEDTGLVEHAMLLAGESAAKWCKDREIPLLFTAAVPHPSFPIAKLNQLEKTDHQFNPVSHYFAKPKPHWTLEMWQYAKITSPLRRYPDFVNQVQIQAYLDAVSRGSETPLTALPFTLEELEGWAPAVTAKLKTLQKLSRGTERHWAMLALFRAFHFKEAQLPEIWDFRVIGPSKHLAMYEAENIGVTGGLLPFVLPAELLASKEQWEKDVKKAQYLPVKIEAVDVVLSKIMVRAVGPPSDTVTTRHPIHIQSSKKTVLASELAL